MKAVNAKLPVFPLAAGVSVPITRVLTLTTRHARSNVPAIREKAPTSSTSEERMGTRAAAFVGLLILTSSVFVSPSVGRAATAKRAAGPLQLTIYNSDQALVREPYVLSLARGRNDLSLEGVPRRIDSTSVRLEGDGFRVTRQSFDYDLWSGDRVFRRFLGDSIGYRYAGRAFRGRLVGIEGDDLFIERRDSVGVLTMINRHQISELEFPPRMGLATRPSLRWELESAKGGDQPATLTYLTAGIAWTAEYAATLEPDEREVTLSGWASIVNRA